MAVRVSIVIPAFNAGRYIEETICSVQAQSFKDWELIVVDDGSTDDTASVVKALMGDGRIRYHYQSNAGVAAARNKGIGMSKGAYIALLDADDVWLPEKLSKMMAVFQSETDLCVLHTDMDVIDGQSQPTGGILTGREGHLLKYYLLWDGVCVPCPASNLVMKREVFDTVGGFDPQFSTAADQDFMFRVSARYHIRRLPEILFRYRVHGSNMHQNIPLMEHDHLRVYRKAHANGLFETAAFRRRCFSNLYLVLAGSWWKDGGNKMRGLYWLLRSLFIWPKQVFRVLSKLS